MVYAVIPVGKPVNLEAVQAVKQIGKANPVFAELFAEASKAAANQATVS